MCVALCKSLSPLRSQVHSGSGFACLRAQETHASTIACLESIRHVKGRTLIPMVAIISYSSPSCEAVTALSNARGILRLQVKDKQKKTTAMPHSKVEIGADPNLRTRGHVRAFSHLTTKKDVDGKTCFKNKAPHKKHFFRWHLEICPSHMW